MSVLPFSFSSQEQQQSAVLQLLPLFSKSNDVRDDGIYKHNFCGEDFAKSDLAVRHVDEVNRPTDDDGGRSERGHRELRVNIVGEGLFHIFVTGEEDGGELERK